MRLHKTLEITTSFRLIENTEVSNYFNGIEIEFITARKAQVPLYTNAINHSVTKQMFCWIVPHAMCSLKF